MDIDAGVVRYARSAYRKKNLDYCAGSLLDLPLGEGCFDAVVCFEAIEHIEAHGRFLDQVRSRLRPGGLFIVSTPNKRVSADAAREENPFHVRELYYEEFVELLGSRWKAVTVLGQSVCAASRMFPLDDASVSESDDICIRKGGQRFVPDVRGGLVPDYYVAVASDDPGAVAGLGRSSHMIDNSRVLLTDLKEAVAFLNGQVESRKALEEGLAATAREAGNRCADLEARLAAVLNSRAWRLAEKFRRVVYGPWKGRG
jgi:hypothetical protein